MADNYTQAVDSALGALPDEASIDKQLEQSSLAAPLEQSIANSQAVNMQQAMAKPMVDSNQGTVNLINPNAELVSVPADQAQAALNLGYRQPTPEELHKAKLESQYGGLGGAVKAFGEGAARGASFGLSSGAERLLGVPKEDIAGREEANPIASTLGEVAGMAGSLVTGVGEGALLAKAGAAAAKQLAGGTFIREVGQQAVRQAVEFGLMSGGEEIHKAFIEDPNQTAQSAIAHMGLSSVMGGVFGGAFGAAAKGIKAVPNVLEGKFLSQADKAGVEAGDLSAIIRNSDTLRQVEKDGLLASLSRKKADAPEIEKAAKSIGAPVLEGMVSDSKLIQKAEDALINGPPTYSSIKRQELYNQGYKAAESAIDQALGQGSTMSKAEIGNVFKKEITSQLEAQNAPIKQMYDNLKTKFDVIPLRENAGKDVVEELSTFPELRITPNSPQGSLIKNVLKNIENVKTVDDLKIFKSSLREGLGLASTPGEKRIAAIIGDKLTELEESSIESFAKKMAAPEEKTAILSLIDQRKAANKQYSALINKVKTLSEQLGKGKVHGIQDAIHFINEKLTPEEVTQRLFAKNNSEFMSFFQKEFPNQMSLMRDYQKGVLRESASTTGKMSPKVLFNKVNKLEPEIQASLFAPEELAKLKDAETYLRAFPEKFNPSGTANLSAFRSFFEHPMGASVANARDFALDKFVKLAALSPELSQASELAKATVKGWNAMTKGVKTIFDPSSKQVISLASNAATQRDKLKKQIDDYTLDPNRMLSINDNNPIPEYNAPFAETSMRAVNYLAMLKPRTDKFGPLDPPKTPSADAVSAYNRQLDIANNPMLVLNHVKNGTLIPQDMITVQTIYPELYNQMQQKMMSEIVNTSSKGKIVPYKNRMALSLFMGQPLDSTMSPEGIMGAQPQPEQQNPQGVAGGGKVTGKGGAAIGKMPMNFQTPLQSRDASRQKHSN